MTSPLNYQPPTSATHYRPSAYLNLPRYLFSLFLSILLAIVGSALYITLSSRFEPFTFHIAASRQSSTPDPPPDFH